MGPTVRDMSATDAGVTRVVGGGIGAGIAAWLLGYLAVFVGYGSRIENSLGSGVLQLLTGEDVTWKLVGWLFFNAHNVAVEIPGLFGETATNFVTGAEEGASVALLVLPPVVLVVAGVVAVWGTADSPVSAARNGAAVALGYLPASVVSAVLFAVSVGDRSAGPVLVTAVLLAGAVYPLVFGAVGGLVGGHFSAD